MALPPTLTSNAVKTNTPSNANGVHDENKKLTTVLTPLDTTEKVAPSVVNEIDPCTDPALISAWRRFLDYDRVSTDNKRSYTRIREVVILLYFLIAAGAVFTTIMYASGIFSAFQLGVMRFLLITLPFVNILLNGWANQFASSTGWIEYRVGAETIREKIYLYRLRAGEFSTLPNLQDRQRKLLEIINQADNRIDKANATLPYMQPLHMDNKSGFSIPDRVRLKTDTPFKVVGKEYDDGFDRLPVEKYLDFRIRNQVDWYARRIHDDFSSMKKARAFALVIAGCGGVVAAVVGNGLEGLVAITTAAGVALNMKADSRMYGATYATYHLTASRLRNELTQWDILSAEQQADPSVASEIVARMEKILSDERETWRSSAIELQNTADRNINANIRTDGNPIAVETGKANTIAEFPSLQSSIVTDMKQTITQEANAILLEAEADDNPVLHPPSDDEPVPAAGVLGAAG